MCLSTVLYASSGTPDTTFEGDGYLVDANAFEISDVAMQSDGKIVVAGVDATGNSVYVARYTAAGVLDTTFSGDGYLVDTNGSAAHGIAIQSDGKIVVAGIDATGNSVYVARYTTAGALDTTFNTTGYIVDTNGSAAYDLAIQSDGKIVVVGIDPTGDSINSVYIARYTTAGVLDATFSGDGYLVDTNGSAAYGVAIQTDGKIVIAGTDAADDYMYLARYTTAGVLDTTFSGDGYLVDTNGGAASGVALQFDGKIVVTGVNPAGNNVYLARYTTAGVLDTTFSTDGYLVDTNGSIAYGLTIQCDGKIVIVGQDTTFHSVYLARYLPNGLPDTVANGGSGFNQAGTPGYLIDNHDGAAYGVVMQIDGKIVVVGQSTLFASGSIGRYHGFVPGTLNITYNYGGTDAGFTNLTTELGAGTNVPTTNPSKAKKMFQFSDGSYLVATDDGTNTYINKFTVHDAVVTSGFGTDGRLTIAEKTNVSDIFLDQTGALIILGGSGASGSNAGWIKRYSTAGVIDATFAVTDVLDTHTTVRQQSNGRIIVAGMEDNQGMLIAYNSVTGAVDTSFAANGRCQTGAFTSNSVVVNSMEIRSDDIIFGIENDSTNEYALLFAVDENGTFVTSTGDLTGGSYACDTTSNHLVLDADGNVVVISAMSSAPYTMFMSRYSYNGAFALVSSQFLTLLAAATGLTHPIATSMIVDLKGKFIVTGYDVANSTPFIMRVKSDLSDLDTTFNTIGVGGQYNTITNAPGTAVQWYDATITQEGLIVVAGYATIAATNTAYIANFYGDDFIGQYTTSVTAGTAGTIDTNYGTSGYVALSALGAGTPLAGATPQAFLTTSSGSYYIVFDNNKLARLTNGNILDTTFNSTATTNIAGLAVNDTPAGVYSMMIDGSSRLVLTGTTGGAGWIQRYVAGNSGKLDTVANGGIGFNTTGVVSAIPSCTVATKAVEQTLGRVVVAGKKTGGNGALFGFTNTGEVDTTFGTNGVYDTGSAAGVYGLACDDYDRLIIASVHDGAVYVQRISSWGALDTTFRINGTIEEGPGILVNASLEAQVRVVFDTSGNIVVAASTWNGINYLMSVVAYNAAGTAIAKTQLDISGLTAPTLTDLIATADGKLLLAGNQTAGGSGNDVDMWIARVKDNGSGAYVLDTTFNPSGLDIATGIMNFNFYGGSNPRLLSAIAIYGDGEISMIGSENSVTPQPFLARAYNEVYTSQEAVAPNSATVGTNDLTYGLTGDNEVTFFALSKTEADAAAQNQKARAIALQDDSTYVIALDGQKVGDSASRIFLNLYNLDGVLDTTFNTGSGGVSSGQIEVLPHTYEQEYVNDILTFTTVAGVNKAILAGYAQNTTLNITNSLLMQYTLGATPQMDSSFGGFNEDPSGVAFGGGQKLNVVGRQTSGRIITGGLDQSGNGQLLGYTSTGKLDKSFGSDGNIVQGTTGIYSQVIDTQDRIVIAYNDGANKVAVARILANGSGLDTTFGTAGVVADANRIDSISGNTNFKVAIDQNSKIVVAAVSGTNCVIRRYNANGTAVDVTLTLTFANLGSITGLTISQLLIDENGKAIVVGYVTYAAGTDKIMVIRTLADLTAMDITFNPSGTAGYLAYNNGTSQATYDALIHTDGRIIVGGSQG